MKRYTVKGGKLGSTRGIEPTISTLLLIIITVAGFSLAYGAYWSWTSNQRRGELMRLRERFVAEDIWFRNSSSASIYVFNIGRVDITIAKIQVRGVSCNLRLQNSVLLPGQSSSVLVDYGPGFVFGVAYTFRITTERGTIVEAVSERTR